MTLTTEDVQFQCMAIPSRKTLILKFGKLQKIPLPLAVAIEWWFLKSILSNFHTHKHTIVNKIPLLFKIQMYENECKKEHS